MPASGGAPSRAGFFSGSGGEGEGEGVRRGEEVSGCVGSVSHRQTGHRLSSRGCVQGPVAQLMVSSLPWALAVCRRADTVGAVVLLLW